MVTMLQTAQVFGMAGRTVTIEIDTSPGIHKFTILGAAIFRGVDRPRIKC